MMTDEEIESAMDHAFEINDVDALWHNAELLERSESPLLRARAIGAKGWAHYLKGEYSQALETYERAYAMHSALNNHRGMAGTTGNIGVLYTATNDLPSALQYLHRALSLYETIDHRIGIATVLGNIGVIHFQLSDYPTAMEYYRRAVAQHEALDDISGVAIFTSGIGKVLSSIGDYPAALEHYHRALTLLEEIGDRATTSSTLIDMGNVYLYRGNFAEALDYYQRSLAIIRETNFGAELPVVLVNIVAAYVGLEADDDARELLAQLDDTDISSPGVRIWREFNRAILLERTGDVAGARAALQLALIEANEHGLRAKAVDVHLRLRDLALRQNDLTAYVEHNNQYTRIQEEINGKETAAKLALQEAEIRMAKERSEHEKHLAVLHSTLPKDIADRVARGEQINDHYDQAAVLFMDLVGFTTMSSSMNPSDVVSLMNQIFTTCDVIVARHGLMKIKTIGDSYMAVAFPPQVPQVVRDDSTTALESSEGGVIPSAARTVAERAANAALQMLHAVSQVSIPKSSPDGSPESSHVRVRLGVHCGALTAGVIGTQRLQYDVWGDTVNVASRMESTGEPGKIHVSEAFASFLGHRPRNDSSSPTDEEIEDVIPNAREEWHLALRGETELKGKGTMTTYWLEPA